MGLVVALAAWSSISPPLCEASVYTEALKQNQATWCFEFWANRYQIVIAGIITGAIAVVAASIAWRAVLRQIASNEVGLRIARQQAAVASLNHLVARRKLLNDAIAAVNACENAIGLMSVTMTGASAFVSDGGAPKVKPDISLNVALTTVAGRIAAGIQKAIGLLEAESRNVRDIMINPATTLQIADALDREIRLAQAIIIIAAQVKAQFDTMSQIDLPPAEAFSLRPQCRGHSRAPCGPEDLRT